MRSADDPWAVLRNDKDTTVDDDAYGDEVPRVDSGDPVASDRSCTGDVIAVVGACGGCGGSTVARALALGIAARDQEVRLVDLDLVWGDLHSSWGVPRDRSLDDLVDVRDELAPEHLRMVLAPHVSGVRLLLAPGRPDAERDWDADAIMRLIDGVADGGAVVLDLGRAPTHVVVAACTRAARRIVVAPLTIRGAQAVGRTMDVIGRDVEIVVNRATRDADIGVRGFRRLIGEPIRGELPRRAAEAEEIAAGRRLRRRRPALRRAIDALLAEVHR